MSTVTQSVPPIEQIKTAMRTTWMAGDFGVIAKTIENGAEDLVSRLRIPAGSTVLDVATGTGNVALPLARAGCVVTGVDIAPNLLEQARARAAQMSLSIQFDEGDAEALPYKDGSFDALTTMFGAMFAPRPERVAAEMARVLKPNGLVAMANWNMDSFSGKMFRVVAKHVPPPAGLPSPLLWGEAATVRERLSPYFDQIETEMVPILFDLNTDPAGSVAFFRTYFGPTRMAFERLDEAGKAALDADLTALWRAANTSANPQHATRVPNTYLKVTALKRNVV